LDYATLHTGFADVPVTLQVSNVDLRRLCGSGRFPIRVEFSVHHENGTEIPFLEKMWHPREYTSHPIHVAIDEKQLRKRFFADFLSDDELIILLTRFYDYETAKRSFRLQPYFTEHNFRYWMVDICAHRQMTGLAVDDRAYCGSTGFVDWAHLYPKGTDERMRIHKLMNRLGREKQQSRRINAPYNRIRCSGGRRYGIGL
jgi:hypothetical protein